jgi:hypothetical protein
MSIPFFKKNKKNYLLRVAEAKKSIGTSKNGGNLAAVGGL